MARLLCVPGAGASAARFERLRPALADAIELRTFELPGRGIRFAEPSFTSLTDHVTHFIERIEAEPYQRWILLGESLGALTSVLLARALADSMRADVIGVVTVAAAPQVTGQRSTDEVLELLRADASSQTGRPMPMAAEIVAADIAAAHALGQPSRPRPVDVPLATVHGSADSLISQEAARGWEARARAGWWFREVPGNHYQFEQPTDQLITAIRDAIAFILKH